MTEPFLGSIVLFAGNFAPRGWALCNGQILSIASNTALFSILGTTYGGNGQTTFALPDFRGRTPMNWGQGPGLSIRDIGEMSGSETVTLISTQMPMHNHLINASAGTADQASPNNNFLAVSTDPDSGGNPLNFTATANGATLNPQAVGLAGGSQPHNNMQPFLAVSFIIALEGIFPSRN
ncbi:MAG TPA: tail fiber protein [Mucilaginibacter sp.]|nr:tail fiber protein [Mucilaginibacter sp.]